MRVCPGDRIPPAYLETLSLLDEEPANLGTVAERLHHRLGLCHQTARSIVTTLRVEGYIQWDGAVYALTADGQAAKAEAVW